MLVPDIVVVFGLDVAFGGVFHCTVGLLQKYGKTKLLLKLNCIICWWYVCDNI